MAPTPCGAVPLEDAAGEIIGWATDTAGHTSETVMPGGRSPETIAANARAFAESRAMLAVMAALIAIEPLVTARLMIAGHDPELALSLAAEQARAIQTRVFAGTPRR